MDLQELRPTADRIVARRLEMPASSLISQTIAIPDCAYKTEDLTGFLRSNKSTRGVVESVGPGKKDEHGKRRPMAVKPGDIIWWGPYIDLEDGERVLVQEQDIRLVEGR